MTDTAPFPIPRYGDASLADLLPSTLSALGVPHSANPLGIEPPRGVCVLLIDGMGWEILNRYHGAAPFLAAHLATARPLTAAFPSTTAANLSSLGTGRPPGEHGIVGLTMGVPGQADRPMHCLTWRAYGPGQQPDLRDTVIPEQVQPHATAFERAVEHGVAVTLVGPAAFAASGLTRAALRGGSYHRVVAIGDLVAEAAQCMSGATPFLVYAYYGDLDTVGHMRGVDSDAWRLQLGHVDQMVAALFQRLPPGATLIVTADHGMVDLQPAELLDIDDAPDLARGVRFLAGEARMRYIFTEPGAAEQVRETWQARLGDHMWILSRGQAVGSGLFGPRVPRTVQERMGEIVAIARGPVGIVQRAVDPGQARFIGHHGSITAAEQLVPCFVLRR